MRPRSTYRIRPVVWSWIVTEFLFWSLLAAAYFVVRTYLPNIVFERPDYAWLLLLLPIIGLAQVLSLALRNRRLKRYADSALLPVVVPHISTARQVLRFSLLRFGLALVIIGLTDPKAGYGKQEIQTAGMELMVCLDVSNSMLAEDLSPNRLELAKRAIDQVIQKLGGDKIGIIVFAGEAFVQLPMTTDYEAARMFTAGISTDMISRQGTAIGNAIDLAMLSFDPTTAADKAVVVLTDGENHEDDALSAAQRAKDLGVAVHAIGLGSTNGAPIPIYRGSRRVGFREDRQGNTVVTALNESMLQELVAVSEGVFIRSGTYDVGLSSLIQRIQEAEKAELEAFTFKDYRHRFLWFLIPGFALLVFEALIAERRQRWSQSLNLLD